MALPVRCSHAPAVAARDAELPHQAMLRQVKLDLSLPAAELTASLVDVGSVSGAEQRLSRRIAEAISGLPHLSVHRVGNAIVARTDFGKRERVVLAGHID